MFAFPSRIFTPYSARRVQGLLLLACTLAVGARAGETETPLPENRVARWEGALGLTTSYRPEYEGASRHIVKLSPALFIRYGRFTVTNASGFVTRSADDVVRGLGADLISSDRLRVSAALRIDAGRNENSSTALNGLGNIRPTLRVRVSGSWRLGGPWRAGSSWSFVALGRGGGYFGDVSAGWEQRIGAHTVLTVGSSLSMGGDRYMQTYYGVNAEQAARTAYPVYTPRTGLRDAALYVNLRHDYGREWTLLSGANATRLLGPAADSPLTGRKTGWGVNVGLARRF